MQTHQYYSFTLQPLAYSLGKLRYILKNHLDNVRAAVGKNLSDNTTQLLTAIDYFPFGMELPGCTYRSINAYRFGYQGQFAEKDEETGYNAFELRLYDPRIIRWHCPDPYNQYWSSYMAMGNNPVNTVDPNGGIGIFKKNPVTNSDYKPTGNVIEQVNVYAESKTIWSNFIKWFDSFRPTGGLHQVNTIPGFGGFQSDRKGSIDEQTINIDDILSNFNTGVMGFQTLSYQKLQQIWSISRNGFEVGQKVIETGELFSNNNTNNSVLDPNKTSPIERVATISVDGLNLIITDTMINTTGDSAEFRNYKGQYGNYVPNNDTLFKVEGANGFYMK